MERKGSKAPQRRCPPTAAIRHVRQGIPRRQDERDRHKPGVRGEDMPCTSGGFRLAPPQDRVQSGLAVENGKE